MKNFVLLFILSAISITTGDIVAQDSDKVAIEQILVLESGLLLKGEIAIIDKKTIRFSQEDYSFVIKKKDIRLTLPADLFSNSKEVETESLVILKSNKWLKAQIIELIQHSVVLKSNDVTSTLPTSKILKIYPAGQVDSQSENFLEETDAYSFIDLSNLEKEEEQKEEAYKEKDQKKEGQKGKSKVYNVSYINIPLGINDNTDFQFEERSSLASLGVQHTVGYKFNQYFGLGVNLGYTVFTSRQNTSFCGFIDCEFGSISRNVDAMFGGIDIRGEISKWKLKPYYNIGFGFNKTLRGRTLNNQIARTDSYPELEFDKKASKAKLGWQLLPAIGFQADMKSMKLLIDLGYQMANINYENGQFNFEATGRFYSIISNDNINNFVLRVGLML